MVTGGIFNSMLKKGVLEDMKSRGIKWTFIGSVDNVLLKSVDSLLIGMSQVNNTPVGTRTILKNAPNERVGIFCKQNNKVKVIEYTEIPEEIAEKKDKNGEFVFGESHIMCNLFHIDSLKRASTKELNYHVAFKKSNYIDENGDLVIPSEPNCYKFEKFIFDAFSIFDDISILRGKREEDFAPVKNAKGIDSPETAKILYESYWKKVKK